MHPEKFRWVVNRICEPVDGEGARVRRDQTRLTPVDLTQNITFQFEAFRNRFDDKVETARKVSDVGDNTDRIDENRRIRGRELPASDTVIRHVLDDLAKLL